MIDRILDTLLEADSQPRDWYAGLTTAAGHGVLVGMPAALALHGLGLSLALTPLAVALIYFLGWERLIQKGQDVADSLVDAVHVALGAAIIAGALAFGFWGAVAGFAAWAPVLMAGVWRRLACSSSN
ncbi:hypothetical protein [Cereibacter sediminicola]|nr:hypothetical protein [Cereibacter sediminicola]